MVHHPCLRKWWCKDRQTQWMCDSSGNAQRHAGCVTTVYTDKTTIMTFITNNLSHSALHISYKEQYIGEMVNTKFLGLQIDNHLNWKNHIEQMIPKLSGAFYAVRAMVHISNSNQFIMHTFILLLNVE
jgi:hypothetical protein